MATLQAVLGNLTASDRQILTAVNTGASSLSLVGSGFIVLCYLLFKELRKFSFKLVFFLALSVRSLMIYFTVFFQFLELKIASFLLYEMLDFAAFSILIFFLSLIFVCITYIFAFML